MYELLEPYLPRRHGRQVTLDDYVRRVLPELGPAPRILDLGCGEGGSCDYFRTLLPEATWIGLDIADSPEVNARKRQDAAFHTYDGVHVPFEDAHFDLVYSSQVFEHVRYPQELLREVRRVLRPGGYFVGSTSHLEPYHSRSFWNFTPYGFCVLIRDSALDLAEIGPSIDSLTLIIRRVLGCPPFFARYWRRESPLNALIGLAGRVSRMAPERIAAAKLLFSGQFCFLARRPQEAS